MRGFTWLPLTDGVESAHGGRRTPNGQGLYDLERAARPTAEVYRGLIERWSGMLGKGAETAEVREMGSAG